MKVTKTITLNLGLISDSDIIDLLNNKSPKECEVIVKQALHDFANKDESIMQAINELKELLVERRSSLKFNEEINHKTIQTIEEMLPEQKGASNKDVDDLLLNIGI